MFMLSALSAFTYIRLLALTLEWMGLIDIYSFYREAQNSNNSSFAKCNNVNNYFRLTKTH